MTNQQVIIEVSPPRDPTSFPKEKPVVIVLDNPRKPTPADEEQIKAEQQRESEVEPCTESMDKDDLVRQGNRDISRRQNEDGRRCFQIALSKEPTSIAALDGASRTCDRQTDRACRLQYLSQIVGLRPDFFEDRVELAHVNATEQDQSSTIGELQKILAENPPPVVRLRVLNDLIFIAQRAGQTQDEIRYRQEWSEIARRYFAIYPKNFDAFYSRVSIVFSDEPLALRLEGFHQWAQAEEVYRRNLSMINVDPLFEKEVKFDNELGLARALADQGQAREAERICSEWKLPVRFIAGPSSTFNGYASPQVEIAKWDLSCGKEREGLMQLDKESATHPWVYGACIALRDYYYAHGDTQHALKADEENSKAHRLADARISSNMR